MSKIRPGTCGDPGPYKAHCTDYPGHYYSCYDSGDDVSFNHRQDFEHHCDDTTCARRDFVNVGD
ncbi:hypothetical protein H7K45_27790 [Mycobacterium yunnanensis]|uniref:Uncharacterized protein n=1 Tax=Mycobacterium yunnanensis TaxID=368477 RepID=A0A9X3BW63_9MYCO|nr:hypothetical protein [Mycobacterium yunnanensis]MCV7424354.1 hypothetical protein [Mycobacterium yunnanensis]